jgi:hypothetical protein
MQRPEMRQLKQRVIASYHLGPLDAEETRYYIEHRLRHVGWTDRPGFDASAFNSIHVTTEGIPRRINTLCDRLLLAAFLGEKSQIAEEDVTAVAREQALELGGEETSDASAESSDQGLNAVGKNADTARRAVRTDALNSLQGSASDRIVQLEERIEMLEASNAMMFNLMRKVLRVMRQPQLTSPGPATPQPDNQGSPAVPPTTEAAARSDLQTGSAGLHPAK